MDVVDSTGIGVATVVGLTGGVGTAGDGVVVDTPGTGPAALVTLSHTAEGLTTAVPLGLVNGSGIPFGGAVVPSAGVPGTGVGAPAWTEVEVQLDGLGTGLPFTTVLSR